MKAYVIAEVMIRDEGAAEEYRRLAAASIAAYDGRYLVRGAPADVLEGAPSSGRIVIVEFPSAERARQWYTSPAYAEALRARERALDRRLLLVEGPDGEMRQVEARLKPTRGPPEAVRVRGHGRRAYASRQWPDHKMPLANPH